MEPSASLWDCGEFISTSYKMQIGHPPGAPLFMMINRIFSMFAADVTDVAMMINFASVIASAATIMFLYWTIAHLALKIVGQTRETAEPKNSLLIYGSAFVGAMSYAFTDTFWFSAVEAEVYAQSSLFTAMVFWAMFKWENESDKTYGTRWLILIAYLMGLSIGVHLLNLLSIPALVMIYYYKMYPTKSKKGWWTAFSFSIVLLAAVLFIIIPKTVQAGAWLDRIFSNSFGFEKNVGFLFFVVLLMSALAYGVYYTHKKKRVILNTVLLCLGVLMIGYGTYASVIIRSSANPPMNSNQPDDPYSLLSFLNREQYGATPLISGQYYSAKVVDYDEKKKYYYDEESKTYKHITVPDEGTIEYAPGTTTIFPRLWDSNSENGYKDWVNIKGKDIHFNGEVINVPTFAENLEYFFRYQINYMYWRYFLWNFVGRQNDMHGEGGAMKGNWLSGIDFIDEIYLGSQDNLPQDILDNQSRNTYFFLPFLLGLAGIVFQLSKRRDDFIVVSFLFLMTGLAITLYLNQQAPQVRERDYAYAGSFYAFSIWIGLGVFWLQSIVEKVLKSKMTSSVVAIILAMFVPIILIAQNWDDHDRSHRYVASDFGKNYLLSTLPNSILITYGDNDTFGPWYAQEVEGVRTDVRICNLSYIQSNWYAQQMKYKFNESLPIEFAIPERVYGSELNNSMPIMPRDSYTDINSALKFIAIDNENKRAWSKQYGIEDGMEIFPSSKIAIPVNKENALKAGIITEKDLPNVVDTIYIELKGNSIARPQYLLLDMIATSDWSRPIYFTQSRYGIGELGLSDYLQFDGFAYKLVPIKTTRDFLAVGKIDTDYLYNKVMNEYGYGNIKDPRVNLDIFNLNNISVVYLRNIFARLAIELAKEGDIERGSEVILKGIEEVPFSQVGHDYTTGEVVKALAVTGNKQKAIDLMQDGIDYYISYLDYFSQTNLDKQLNFDSYISNTLQNIMILHQMAVELEFEEQAEQLKPFTEMY